jgi:hypothetical protein
MIASRMLKAAALAAVLTGCGMSEYEDISSDPRYHPLVGQQLEATSDLYLHAVTLDRNYAKRVDTCSITMPPGFGGPELVYRRTLPAGTTFHVLSVRRCTNCPFDERVEMVVAPQGDASCGEAPVTIDDSILGSGVRTVANSHGGTPNNSFKPKPLRGSA